MHGLVVQHPGNVIVPVIILCKDKTYIYKS